jgi:hypothetical protein
MSAADDGDTNGSGASEWQPYDGAAFESSAEKGACPICTVEFSAVDGCQALTYACCDKVRRRRGAAVARAPGRPRRAAS